MNDKLNELQEVRYKFVKEIQLEVWNLDTEISDFLNDAEEVDTCCLQILGRLRTICNAMEKEIAHTYSYSDAEEEEEETDTSSYDSDSDSDSCIKDN